MRVVMQDRLRDFGLCLAKATKFPFNVTIGQYTIKCQTNGKIARRVFDLWFNRIDNIYFGYIQAGDTIMFYDRDAMLNRKFFSIFAPIPTNATHCNLSPTLVSK